MQAPNASELLAVWERARAQPITTQALMLLEGCSPSAAREDLAKLSVGRRDSLLLTLRELLFGARLNGVIDCPRCGQQLEIGIEASDIHADVETRDPELLMVTSGAHTARFRLPNSDDLATLAGNSVQEAGDEGAIRTLLSRCLVELRRNGRKQRVDSSHALPASLIDAIAAE